MNEINFRIVDYKLVKLFFTASNQENAQEDSDQVIEPSFQMNYQLLEDSKVTVMLSVKIEGATLPFSIEAEIVGLFELNATGISKERLERLATINLNGVLFPFLREVVADCTRRAGYSPLLLPSVNFVKVYQERHLPSN